jgi:hypothetical protein
MNPLETTTIGAAAATLAAGETNDTAIRPFRVNVPDADLADLKRRLTTTRWPDQETVADQSRGAGLLRLPREVLK